MKAKLRRNWLPRAVRKNSKILKRFFTKLTSSIDLDLNHEYETMSVSASEKIQKMTTFFTQNNKFFDPEPF
jgi:hypothetical protein